MTMPNVIRKGGGFPDAPIRNKETTGADNVGFKLYIILEDV